MPSNPIDIAVTEVKSAYLDFKSQISAEVKAYATNTQIIKVNLPNITRCKNINITEESSINQNIIQFTNSSSASSMSTILSSKLDAKLNSMNKAAEAGFKDALSPNSKDLDSLSIKEDVRSLIHYSINTSVSSFASAFVVNQQNIILNPNGSSRYLECDTLNIAARSIINMQMVQLTTLILDKLKENPKYSEGIQKLINGQNKDSLSLFLPGVFPSSKFFSILSVILVIVLLIGIFILLIVLVINISKKKKS
jgi:hypothetical protein